MVAQGEATATTDHDEIRSWAEERGGRPATVPGTKADGGPGVLVIWFPEVGATEEELQEISWDEWFDKFEESSLAFLHQDRTSDGEISRFFKLVSRDRG